jgi:hypothetical protein
MKMLVESSFSYGFPMVFLNQDVFFQPGTGWGFPLQAVKTDGQDTPENIRIWKKVGPEAWEHALLGQSCVYI